MEKLTHIDKLRNPNYLGGWDLKDVDGQTINIQVTIKDIKAEMVFNQKTQDEQQVLTVFFNECKPIILNATNRKMLKKVTETDFIEKMVGKKIELTTKKIKAFGEMHDAIRIVPLSLQLKNVFDNKNAFKILEESKTIDELIVNWNKLSPQEKNQPEILAKKETLKVTLK